MSMLSTICSSCCLNLCCCCFPSRYVKKVQSQQQPVAANASHVIAMSLHGTNPRYTYGAVRNLQLHKILLPEWTVRVYVHRNSNNIAPQLAVPELVINKLRLLGAQIVYVNASYANIEPGLWRYDVMDDPAVERFIILDTDKRLDETLEKLASQWLSRGGATVGFLCAASQPLSKAIDSPDSARKALLLFGAKRTALTAALGGGSFKSLVSHYIDQNKPIGVGGDKSVVSPNAAQNVTTAATATAATATNTTTAAAATNTTTTTAATATVAAMQSATISSGERLTEAFFLQRTIIPLLLKHGQCVTQDAAHNSTTSWLGMSKQELTQLIKSEMFKGSRFDQNELEIS